MTDAERKALIAEYLEGIPPWMLARATMADQVREWMELRRRAFPKTKPGCSDQR